MSGAVLEFDGHAQLPVLDAGPAPGDGDEEFVVNENPFSLGRDIAGSGTEVEVARGGLAGEPEGALQVAAFLPGHGGGGVLNGDVPAFIPESGVLLLVELVTAEA